MKKVKALFDFWGESAAELSFQAGEILTVIKQDDPGWWEGELNGRKGLFPSNYVEPVKDTEVLTANPALAARPIAAVNTRPPSQPLPTAHAAARSPPPHQVASRALPPPVHQTHAIPENKPSTFSPPPGSVSASVISSTPAAAAASSSGGERKPAGQVVGGGGTEENKKLLVSKTKIGLWSSNIAFYSGLTMIPLGLLAVLWHLVDGDRWSVQTLLSGIYSVVIGIGIMFYETYYGQTRGPSRFPLRAIVYIGLSVYLFFALATLLGGLFLILAGVTNFIACVLLKEVYDAPPPRVHAKVASDLPPASSFCEGLSAWASAARQQNKKGVVVFMLIYVLGNLGLFAWTVNHWALKNESLPPGSRLSDYGPWAKGFGSLLDLNCAIIVLPVSRTLLRLLYNRSTADQGFLSRTLRAVLEYVPLDQNITFHKIIAWVILIAACGHIGLHFANLAFAYTNTVAIFGGSAWFTGGMICVWMMLIYSATPENTRRGQFEVFWYSHHCFVLFFIFILFHGKGGINPHYWMYAIPTMTIYVIERLLRVYRASLPVSILSISLMDDVMSLEFAKEGFFETESYKEGQYLFLLSPPISRVQWHPFTISSAPQEASVTVHIRVMGEGSWTRGLMQYLSTMGPKGRSFIPLDRMGPSGKVPGKICGPDGRALLQIDGPHCLLRGTEVRLACGAAVRCEDLKVGAALQGRSGPVRVTQLGAGSSASMVRVTDDAGRRYTVTPGHKLVLRAARATCSFRSSPPSATRPFHEMSLRYFDRATFAEKELRCYWIPAGEQSVAAAAAARRDAVHASAESARQHLLTQLRATVPRECMLLQGEVYEVTAEELLRNWDNLDPQQPQLVAVVLPSPTTTTQGGASKAARASTARIAHVELLQRGGGGGYPFVSVEVDGDHMYVLGNGTLTHNSAPTQHIGEYSTVIVVGAGIGATPVSSTLKSIVHHTWRLNIGQCFPASAYFVWVCAYRDVDAFRWLIRTIKEACDEVTHMRANGASMAGKNFAVHIFLTSAPKNAKPVNVVVDDEIGFWGPPREASKLDKVRANWDEIDLYKVLKCPAAHTQLGDVHVWSGRPNWNDRFAAVSAAHPSNTVGVTFCGNPLIAKDLRKQCFLTNKNRADNAHFKLHKENF